MPPANNPNQTVQAQPLPPLQPMPPQQTEGIPSQAASQQLPELDIVARAKVIISQNAGDPYKLNLALQQLKAEHLAAKFNIAPKAGS